MNDKTYLRLRTLLILICLISVIALAVWTIVAYRNASILDYIAGEVW